jgi:type IV secretory pathway TraG/TraD family ATPase VirD4
MSRGVACWTSVEDSMVVLGPPRSGKGLHVVVPMIVDSIGAVITTSTRPDNLAITFASRSRRGPVAVFDPQGLASGVPSATRWSPIRGCEDPQVAMIRARALCAERVEGVENGSFWTQQCLAAVRCLLHAAALGGVSATTLYDWSLSPVAAEQAVEILLASNGSAAWWSALRAMLSSDPRQRDSIWAMVSNVFAAFADPKVLRALSPEPGEQFEPATFLRDRGTLYLLGTATGSAATATLVSALIEDVLECARRQAAESPGSRLDPPLSVVLDEAANYPLPSLPALMSDGGGTGITTFVVLQSLAQARARWGQHEASTIWDSAIVKVILGGGGNADDLRDLSALIGTRSDVKLNSTWGADGKRSVSAVSFDTPILDPGRLRTLRFGMGVLLLRSAAPIMLTMSKWTDRPDAPGLRRDRSMFEAGLARRPV